MGVHIICLCVNICAINSKILQQNLFYSAPFNSFKFTDPWRSHQKNCTLQQTPGADTIFTTHFIAPTLIYFGYQYLLSSITCTIFFFLHTYGRKGGRTWPVVCLNLWYLVGCWCMSCWELGGLDDILGGLALCCQSSCIQMAIRELSYVIICINIKVFLILAKFYTLQEVNFQKQTFSCFAFLIVI